MEPWASARVERSPPPIRKPRRGAGRSLPCIRLILRSLVLPSAATLLNLLYVASLIGILSLRVHSSAVGRPGRRPSLGTSRLRRAVKKAWWGTERLSNAFLTSD